MHHPHLFQSVGDAVASKCDLNEFKPQDLANIVWAYATSNTQHRGLFQKIGETVAGSDGSKEFTTQNLANIVWAYAKLDVKHPGLFNKIGKSIGALNDLSSFTPQHLANIAWSFAVTDVNVPMAFNDSFTAALVEKQNELNVRDLTQLYEWHVWQVAKSNTGLPEMLKERCEGALKNSRSSSLPPDDSSSSIILRECQSDLKDNHLPKIDECEHSTMGDSTPIVGSISSESLRNPLKADDLQSLTVPQLKELLRSKGSKVGGRKDELISRILEE